MFQGLVIGQHEGFLLHTHLSRNHPLAISPCFHIPNEDSLFRFNYNWLFIPYKWFLNRCICYSFNRLEEFYYLLMGIQYPPTPLLITEGVCAVKKYSTLNGSFLYHRLNYAGYSYRTNGSSRTSTICWSITGVLILQPSSYSSWVFNIRCYQCSSLSTNGALPVSQLPLSLISG